MSTLDERPSQSRSEQPRRRRSPFWSEEHGRALMWWEAQALAQARRDPEVEERLRQLNAQAPAPIPRDEAFLRETLAAYQEESTLAEYTRRRDQYFVYGVVAMLEWVLGIRDLTPIYGRVEPINSDTVADERSNADDQMRGREEPVGKPMAYYRGVENAASWILGEDMWLDPPQLQPGFRWSDPGRHRVA